MYINIMVLIALCVLMPATACKIVPADRRKALYIALALLAVAARIATIFYLYRGGRGGTETFGTDGLLYHREGMRVARQLAAGVPLHEVEYGYTWYTVFVGLIYHLFGTDRYIASYVNAALAFYSAMLLLKISINNGCKFSNAAFVSLAFLYFPNLLLWTSDSRKESLLIFLILLCWYLVQRFMNITKTAVEKSTAEMPAGSGRISKARLAVRLGCRDYMKGISFILSICVLMWLCTLIRIYMFLPLAAGILAGQHVFYKKYRSRVGVIFFIAVIACSMAIFFATTYPLLENYHAISFPGETGNFESDVLNKIKKIALLALDRNIIFSAVNFIILPLPGSIDIADIGGSVILRSIVSIDMIAWYICILLMIPGIRSTIIKREGFMIGILAFLFSYILINILVVENVEDTIYRYRSVIVGASLLFIEWGGMADVFSKPPLHLNWGIKDNL